MIDEVQKVPALLDEVHRLIEMRGLRFILSGSSARKLRRGGTNLLAGRALVNDLYPLVAAEMDFQRPSDESLRYGSLPSPVMLPSAGRPYRLTSKFSLTPWWDSGSVRGN